MDSIFVPLYIVQKLSWIKLNQVARWKLNLAMKVIKQKVLGYTNFIKIHFHVSMKKLDASKLMEFLEQVMIGSFSIKLPQFEKNTSISKILSRWEN